MAAEDLAGDVEAEAEPLRARSRRYVTRAASEWLEHRRERSRGDRGSEIVHGHQEIVAFAACRHDDRIFAVDHGIGEHVRERLRDALRITDTAKVPDRLAVDRAGRVRLP